jgi:ABC-type glycerol-3-phosphate transport system substrate-binding protein
MRAGGKNNLKSVFTVLLLGLAAVNFTGCSNKPPSEAKGKTVISVWHWMTDRQAAFDELAKRYELATGVKVSFELYAPSDAYTQKVRAAAQGVNLPDVFGVLAAKRDFASFINAGHILDITPEMDEDNSSWRKSFFQNALLVNEFKADESYNVKPGIYGVPIDTTAIEMLYNKKLYAQLGFNPNKPPSTFEDLIQIGNKLKDKQLQGFVSGWGEYWMLDCFANNYAFNVMGKDKVLATIKGEVPYTDPDWVTVFSLFKKLQDSGILSSGIITMVNKTAEQLFANEKAVFAFNGSWCVNVYKAMNPKLEYGVFFPPKLSDKYPMMVWGGAGSSFVVNARSKNKAETIKFLRWLTAKDQQAYLSATTNNLPANKDCLNNIPGLLSDFAKNMEFTTHPSVWGISEYSAVVETLDRGLQAIILGQKSPEQVAQEVQKVKEREMAKAKAR